MSNQDYSELQHQIEVFTRQLEKLNKDIISEKEKNAIYRNKLERIEEICETYEVDIAVKYIMEILKGDN